MNVTAGQDNVLQSGWEHIRDGRAEAALVDLAFVPEERPEVLNARAVALMLLGDHDQAIELLRPLLFPEDGLMMDPNADPARAVNYCLALLRSGNVQGFLTYLPQLPDSDHPGAESLRALVAAWQDRRKAVGWWKRATGSAPSLILPDDFPPGWRETHPSPRQPGTPPGTAGASASTPRCAKGFGRAQQGYGGQDGGQDEPAVFLRLLRRNRTRRHNRKGDEPRNPSLHLLHIPGHAAGEGYARERGLPRTATQVRKTLRHLHRGGPALGHHRGPGHRGQVLPLCLAEIERSRPYFIGLLGERYGWNLNIQWSMDT